MNKIFITFLICWGVVSSLVAQVTPDTTQVDSAKSKATTKGNSGTVTDSSAIIIIQPDSNAISEMDTTASEIVMTRKDSMRWARINGPVNRPRTAWRRSAILPGLGQIYNHSAWKVPVIYAGFAVIGYFIWENNDIYHDFQREYIARNDTNVPGGFIDPFYSGYTPEGLRSNRDKYRQYRDLNVLFAGLWYCLNLVDAYVEAHLDEFDISDNLSLRISPGMLPTGQRGKYVAGATFSFTLK